MIPFNRASFEGHELQYFENAIRLGQTAGNGTYTKRAEAILSDMHDEGKALLTTSCTHALEMSARLLDLGPGDEVIVPAFTFVSTASAFVWNGAKPVFADVRPDTLNIDPLSVEPLINERTKAICIVHYGGVGAQPDIYASMAARHNVVLIEDNAHGLGATYKGKTLGSFGSLSTLSFHETKNVTCGEGGALVVNDHYFFERAEILREKGTDRGRFSRGQVKKYRWLDVGSSWVLSDLLAAILVGQLERFEEVAVQRRMLWSRYQSELCDWAAASAVAIPYVPVEAKHSSHLFYLRLPSRIDRDKFIRHMRNQGILVVSHYESLSDSPQGMALSSKPQLCPNSAAASDTLVRLPLFVSLTDDDQSRILDAVISFDL